MFILFILKRKLQLMIRKLLLNIFLPISLLISYSAALQAQQEPTKVVNNDYGRLTLYPIPADNKITIKLNNQLKENVGQIQIVNVIGRVLKEQQIINKNTSEVTFNDLGDLPQGIYMVIARDNYGKILQSTRLIISR